jgi:Putative phage tail protein
MHHLIKHRPLRDRVIAWALLAALAVAGLFPSRPRGAYLADPFSGAMLTSLLISGIMAGASYGYQLIQASRQKVPPTDRGRLNDIRMQANGYGEFILRGYGKFRAAGFLLDATNIVHTTTTTPGHGGGKGAVKPPTPGTVNHVYTTTLDIGVCEGLSAIAPNLTITRIWENFDTVYDTSVTQQGDNLYEAERGGNTLAGGGTVVSDAAASGGQVVSLPVNASIQWNGVYGTGAQAVLEIYYASTTTNSVEFTFAGTGTTTFTATLNNSGEQYIVYRSAPFALNSGFTNTVKIKNLSATTLLVDALIVRVSGQGTGAVNPHIPTPTDDLTNPLPKYGYFPQKDANGVITGQIVAGGNANVRIYTGTETQGADSAFVSLRGADNTPAYRGLVHVVFDSYQVKDAFLPNYSFEVDTGVTSLPTIVQDLYGLVNVGPTQLDLSALAGLSLDVDEGFLITSRDSAGRWLEDLKTCFQFDLPEVDGKAKAVLRGGASVATVTADELRAHGDKDTPPDLEVDITDADPILLPQVVEVGTLDPLNDYHTNVMPSRRLSGIFGDKQTVNLSMILRQTRSRQLAETILYRRHQESRTLKIQVGPRYQKMHPGDVMTIQTSTNAVHTGRITAQDWKIMGVQGLELVRTLASDYSQSITGPSTGYEPPVISYPGNTKLLILDIPLLRPEDAGDGTQPVVYIPTCLIGSGTWRGAFLHKERPLGSGSYKLETTFDTQAVIGTVVSGSAGTIDPTVWDKSTSFVVDLYPDATLSSVQELDILQGPEINLAAIGSMANGWYVFQFAAGVPGTPAAPFQTRYSLSDVAWGVTGPPPAGSLAGMDFVLLNSAVKPRAVELTDLGLPRNYRCATSGQSVADAQTVQFTLQAISLKSLQPTQPAALRAPVTFDLGLSWTRRHRLSGQTFASSSAVNEEEEKYTVEFRDSLNNIVRRKRVLVGQPQPAFLRGGGAASVSGNNATGTALSTGYAYAEQKFGLMDAGRGSFVEFTLRYAGTLNFRAGLIPANVAPFPYSPQYEVRVVSATGGGKIQLYENGVLVFTDAVFDNSVYNPRVRFQFSVSGVEVYRTISSVIPQHDPIWRFATAPAGDLRPFFEVDDTNQVSNVVVATRSPFVNYLGAEQQADFGVTQSTHYVRVYQVSGQVGAGQPLDMQIAFMPGVAGDGAITLTSFP